MFGAISRPAASIVEPSGVSSSPVATATPGSRPAARGAARPSPARPRPSKLTNASSRPVAASAPRLQPAQKPMFSSKRRARARSQCARRPASCRPLEPESTTMHSTSSSAVLRGQRLQRAGQAGGAVVVDQDDRQLHGRLVGAGAADHGRDGLREDRDVQPDRPVLEVVEVEPDQVVEAEARAARDLPEAGHAGEHEVALAVPGLELLVVAQRQRPRADEAHLAAEHVPELRDLVQREAPEDRADRGHARVLADLEQRAVRLVRGLELPPGGRPRRPASSGT